MPRPEYEALPDSLKTVKLDANKSAVKFLLYESDSDIEDEVISSLSGYQLVLPQMSTDQMRQRI